MLKDIKVGNPVDILESSGKVFPGQITEVGDDFICYETNCGNINGRMNIHWLKPEEITLKKIQETLFE